MQETDDKLEVLRMEKAKILLMKQSMPENIIELHTAEDFNTLIRNYPEKIIIIDFWAVWCGPCIYFAPVFKKLQEEFRKDFIFAKVNVDESNTIAMKYMISSIPTTLFIRNGHVINKTIGTMNYDVMKQILEKLKHSSY